MYKKRVPIHNSVEIAIKANNIAEKWHEKLLMVSVNESSGKYYAAGGEYSNGWVKSSIRNFGNYAIVADSIPPKITPLSIENNKTLKETTRIRFKISDDLSGISEIEGFLDGKWALFEYDAKIM